MGGMMMSLTNDETILRNVRPDDDPHRHVDDVALDGELLEFLEHSHGSVSSQFGLRTGCRAAKF